MVIFSKNNFYPSILQWHPTDLGMEYLLQNSTSQALTLPPSENLLPLHVYPCWVYLSSSLIPVSHTCLLHLNTQDFQKTKPEPLCANCSFKLAASLWTSLLGHHISSSWHKGWALSHTVLYQWAKVRALQVWEVCLYLCSTPLSADQSYRRWSRDQSN